jgi:DNA-binding CsgD family transcriptional regulator
LTPDHTRRVTRALRAAQAKLDVADPAAAEQLRSIARHDPLDELQRARVERLGAQIVFARNRGREAPAPLLEAARRLEQLDYLSAARETYLEAIASAMFAGRLGTGPDEREIAEAARRSSKVPDPGPADALLDALVTRFTEGYAAAVAPLSSALWAFDGDADQRWLWLACRLSQDLWDDELWHVLATRGVRVARDTGALGQLPIMTNFLGVLMVHSGAFADAAALIDEVDALTQATGMPPIKFAAVALAASRGDHARTRAITDSGLANARARGEGSAISISAALLARLENAHGRYDAALAEARDACAYEDVLAFGPALVELIEAAVRSGHTEEAATALERLSERTQAAGTRWALGVEARSRALVTDDEASYRVAIDQLERSRAAVALARSRLVYGEWLRREHRRVEAREHLRVAHADFSRFGAEAFAERAGRELQATGETARRLTPDTVDELTPQEIQVARLARAGHTNPEIGAQLFISPRTVEYHLRKVFRKLGVSTRRDLREAFAEP